MTDLDIAPPLSAPPSNRSFRYGQLVQGDRVSSRLYTDPDIFDEEIERIWHRDWIYVGHESEIPNAGDYVTRRIGRQPVVMTRGADGQVNLLMNRCPHRGNMVCLDEKGTVEHFRCAYHGWTFDPDGTTNAIPYSGRYGADFSKVQHSMERVPRMGEQRGFIFGSLSRTGLDLLTHLGATADYIDRICDLAPDGTLDLSAGSQKTRIRGNWKAVFENVTDGYHPPMLHRSVFAEYAREGLVVGEAYGDNSQIVVRDLNNGHSMLDFTETNRQTGGPVFELGGPVPAEAEHEYHELLRKRLGAERAQQLLEDGTSLVGVFPNLGMLYQDVRLIQPISVNETILYNFTARLSGAPREVNRARLLYQVRAYGPCGSVGPDDHEVYARNQEGFNAEVNEWLLLSRGMEQEVRVDDGTLVGNATDETTNRGFWRHYREVMSDYDYRGDEPHGA